MSLPPGLTRLPLSDCMWTAHSDTKQQSSAWQCSAETRLTPTGVHKWENVCADHYRDYGKDGWLGLFCSPRPLVCWSMHFHNPANTPPCITMIGGERINQSNQIKLYCLCTVHSNTCLLGLLHGTRSSVSQVGISRTHLALDLWFMHCFLVGVTAMNPRGMFWQYYL